MYGNFAGRDASRGMAKQSFDEGASIMILWSYERVPNHESNPRSVCVDMLTDIDQPLDKLQDLTPDEMYVFLLRVPT